MKHTAFACGIVLIVCAAGCAGGGLPTSLPAPVQPSNKSVPASSTSSFPTMLNARSPVAGHGAGGAIGPANVGPLSTLSMRAASNASRIPKVPVPRAPRLNVSGYGVTPRVIRSTDASFDIAQAISAAKPVRGGIGTADVFTGNGDQDLSAATNGSQIFQIDSEVFGYIYSLSGTLQQQIFLQDFYCGGAQPLPICLGSGFPGDNRVVYDVGANRWITTALWVFQTATAPTDVLAVSQTSDPTGSWNLYQFPACGALASPGGSDQPHIGFNSKWIAITSACDPGFPGLAVFDKNNLYSGGRLVLNRTWFEFDDPVQNGNRDNPALTYAARETSELLTASVVDNGNAAVLYSHVDGPTDAPTFYAGSDEVRTSFPANGGPGPDDAPGCSSCIVSDANGWTHSSGVWDVQGETYIVSTAAVNDPTAPDASQAVSIAVSSKGAANAMRVFGGVAGSGPLASEVSMPLAGGAPTRDRALITYDNSSSRFYPGVMAAQWNIRSNTIEFNDIIERGSSTPVYDAGRWVDFISGSTPIPGTSQLLVSAHVAKPSDFDPERGIYSATASLSRPIAP